MLKLTVVTDFCFVSILNMDMKKITQQKIQLFGLKGNPTETI